MLRFTIAFLARVHAHTLDVTPMPKFYQLFDRKKIVPFYDIGALKPARWWVPRQP